MRVECDFLKMRHACAAIRETCNSAETQGKLRKALDEYFVDREKTYREQFDFFDYGLCKKPGPRTRDDDVEVFKPVKLQA